MAALIRYWARRVLSWALVGGPACPEPRCGRRVSRPFGRCVTHLAHRIDAYPPVTRDALESLAPPPDGRLRTL